MLVSDISLAEAFLTVNKLVLIDGSASMKSDDAPGKITRWEAANVQLRRLQNEQPGKVGVISFSDKPYFAPSGLPYFPSGNTCVFEALEYVKPADGCGIQIVLISDGEGNGEKDFQEVFDKAAEFKSPIHTIYIGPEGAEGKPGRDFLARIAAAGGGKSVSHKIEELGLLSETVKQLTS